MSACNKVKTMADLRKELKKTGHHFFEKGTMRFFGSQVHTSGNLLKGKYFITSEDDFHGKNRFFNIRKVVCIRSGPHKGEITIDPVGKFNTIKTLEDAKSRVKKKK